MLKRPAGAEARAARGEGEEGGEEGVHRRGGVGDEAAWDRRMQAPASSRVGNSITISVEGARSGEEAGSRELSSPSKEEEEEELIADGEEAKASMVVVEEL